MDGMKNHVNGVALFLGRIPTRKQMCFYFTEGSTITVVGYVSAGNEPEAVRLWQKLTQQLPSVGATSESLL